jgi:hypothetical protein
MRKQPALIVGTVGLIYYLKSRHLGLTEKESNCLNKLPTVCRMIDDQDQSEAVHEQGKTEANRVTPTSPPS